MWSAHRPRSLKFAGHDSQSEVIWPRTQDNFSNPPEKFRLHHLSRSSTRQPRPARTSDDPINGRPVIGWAEGHSAALEALDTEERARPKSSDSRGGSRTRYVRVMSAARRRFSTLHQKSFPPI